MDGGVCERKVYPVTAGEYQLLEEVGQGASAVVYRAVCLPFKEVVAIKALDLEKCNSSLDDIRREAVTMSLINHPNVVRAYCSFVVEQRLYVVMPYMAGGSCLQIMKAAFPDGFDEPAIATFLKETLKAIEYLHRHGHIHRDVKAGNILVDGNGAVKLGDFGVSACMFDTGDRQRSRKTFIGTPCWMAPEVMEGLHGYDFKADIWSFGITALELAHGHAPFSKYAPMKVLLMTLQNSPPGLDNERDKVRFSKSFKEMIAMCLVKEPTKRPTAEKLLRHSFFKHARTPDYISRHILDGLPLLGVVYKNLKNVDTAPAAQKKTDFDEQEKKSQTEYQRGVSSWNFDVEDLKAQSALIPDDVNPPQTVKESDSEYAESSSRCYSSEPENSDSGYSPDKAVPVTIHSLNVETANDAGDHVTRVRSGPLPNPAQSAKSTNGQISVGTSGRREPKHIGRFDVFDDDNDLESPGWHGSPKGEHRKGDEREQVRKDREERDQRNFEEKECREDKREQKFSEEKDRDENRKGLSGPLVPERARDGDRDREHRQGGRAGDRGSFSGPLLPTGERPGVDHRPANGVHGIPRPLSGTIVKDGLEERSKGPAQKVPVVQRGRFSVTSDDEELEDPPQVSSRGCMSSQGSQQLLCIPASSSSPNLNGASVSVGAIVPQLQNALNLAIMQQDALMHILSGMNSNEGTNSLRPCNASKRNSSVSAGGEYSKVESQSERERDYHQQIAELQGKLSQLLEEYQVLKMRNVTLERQLNAIYNKEEEERIRKEEAAKGNQ
ncbi:hypothetical protein M758_1G207400 [Ceratodon purpureus]|uniref:Protein kinase domain-containing protein n=1 Tax=Ceratodon purpureus TaxID=3225 RepID=A0A8T0JAH8_CERPU|nr:hypothetical protein KC19_1G214300 [Ceratodon purpureus]KAG0630846.1 hypothetical protein M758_1G207400 [Ceratodon purpureus]